MAQIAVDFLLGPDWSSRIISWWGQGAGGYSHTAGVLSDGRYLDARYDWIGNVPPGVHIRHPDAERHIKRSRAILQCTPAEYAAWECNLRAKIGTPYASIDIWAFITGAQVAVHGVWDCCALQLNALQHIKRVPFPLPIPAHQITPNGLLLVMATAGAVIQTIQP